jgi:hypothetical protein
MFDCVDAKAKLLGDFLSRTAKPSPASYGSYSVWISAPHAR